MNEITTGSGRIIVTEVEKVKLFELGQLRWEEKDIAALMGWPLDAFLDELQNPQSVIARTLLQGELSAQFELEKSLLADAKKGDIDSVIQFNKVMRDRSFKMSKLDLFGGSEDETVFEKIRAYYDSGCKGDMGAREQTYLEVLQMVYSFEVRFGKRKSIKILTKAPYNLSYERAADLISEAVEMFNGGRRVTKEAMRSHLADTYDALYHLMIESATTTKDYAMASSILEKKAKVLQLDKEDDVPIDKKEYIKTFRLLTIEPETVGLPKANRDELAAQIDSIDNLSEQDARRLKMDAGVIDMDIIGVLENVAQEED